MVENVTPVPKIKKHEILEKERKELLKGTKNRTD